MLKRGVYDGYYIKPSKEVLEKLILLGYKASSFSKKIHDEDLYVFLLDSNKISNVDKEFFLLKNFEELKCENGKFNKEKKIIDIFDENVSSEEVNLSQLIYNLKKCSIDNEFSLPKTLSLFINKTDDLENMSDNDLNDLFIDYISKHQNLIKY